MYNILPQVNEKIKSQATSALIDWKPSNANPKTAKISKILQAEFTSVIPPQIKIKDNLPPKPEPNYCSSFAMGKADPSPITKELRGIADESMIVYKPPGEISVKAKFAKMAEMEKSNRLIVKIASLMPIAMDLFVQRKQNIVNTVLTPERPFLKEVGGQIVASPEEVQTTAPLTILCSTVSLSTIVTTNRQEIKDFTFFTHHRIGMEVEHVNDRLICTKVIPATQASFHSEELDSAIVIGINNKRVLTLEDFQEEMLQAKRFKHVTLTLAVYKGGKGKTKIDELYILNNSKNQQVKNLLSSMFGGGGGDDGGRGGGSRGRFGGSLSIESQSTLDEDDITKASSHDENENETGRNTDDEGQSRGEGDGDEVVDEKTRKERERARLRKELRESKKSKKAKKKEKEKKERERVSRGGSNSSSRRHSHRMESSSSDDDDEEDDEEEDEEEEGEDGEGEEEGKREGKNQGLSGYSFLEREGGGEGNAGEQGDDEGEGEGGGMIASKRVIKRDLDIHFHQEYEKHEPAVEERDRDEREVDGELKFAGAGGGDDMLSLADSESSASTWNYMTAGAETSEEKAQLEQVFPFTSLVCIPVDAMPGMNTVTVSGHILGNPPNTHAVSSSSKSKSTSKQNDALSSISRSLRCSTTWGQPKHYLQFSNFSSQWKCEIYWIDEDGGLILRNEVKHGATHFELCSEDHVWVVMATPIVKHQPYGRGGGSSHGSLGHHSHGLDGGPSLHSSTGISSIGTGGVSNLANGLADIPPVIMIVRPSKGSLQEGKCASLIWSPWTSLSLSQIVFSKTSKLGSATNASTTANVVRIEPSIHIQLFDTTKKSLTNVVLHGMGSAGGGGGGMSVNQELSSSVISEANLGKLKRRPLRKSRNMKM